MIKWLQKSDRLESSSPFLSSCIAPSWTGIPETEGINEEVVHYQHSPTFLVLACVLQTGHPRSKAKRRFNSGIQHTALESIPQACHPALRPSHAGISEERQENHSTPAFSTPSLKAFPKLVILSAYGPRRIHKMHAAFAPRMTEQTVHS